MKTILAILLLATAACFADLPRPAVESATQIEPNKVRVVFRMVHPEGAVQIQRLTNGRRNCRWTVVPMQLERSQVLGRPEMCKWYDCTYVTPGVAVSYKIRWLCGAETSAWSQERDVFVPAK